MRVAAVDIGTNSTRLLIADIDGRITELVRRSEVTRLGTGVDSTGALSADAIERVLAVLDQYSEEIKRRACQRRVAVLTSAVRDSTNGSEFTAEIRSRYGLDAHTIDGDREARLTFLGATSERELSSTESTVIVDIGGGSTEFVIGRGDTVEFHISTQTGVVRQTERHLAHDPAGPEEITELREEVREVIARAIPTDLRARVGSGIAVAGTATSCAAIDQQLEPYDSERVHGYSLTHTAVERILTELAPLDLERRRAVRGLHPDRAPTIVTGVAILLETLDAFGLTEVEVSEHDILRGMALEAVT